MSCNKNKQDLCFNLYGKDEIAVAWYSSDTGDDVGDFVSCQFRFKIDRHEFDPYLLTINGAIVEDRLFSDGEMHRAFVFDITDDDKEILLGSERSVVRFGTIYAIDSFGSDTVVTFGNHTINGIA